LGEGLSNFNGILFLINHELNESHAVYYGGELFEYPKIDCPLSGYIIDSLP